jgi:sugar lactone lactonase YvrE
MTLKFYRRNHKRYTILKLITLSVIGFCFSLANAQIVAKPAPDSTPMLKPTAPATPEPTGVLTPDQIALAGMTDVNAVMAKLEEFKSEKDLRRQSYAYKRLSELRPYAGGVMWELARTYAQINERAGAFDTMLRLQQQGFNYDPTGDKAFANIRDAKVFKYIVQALQTNAKPFGEGKVAFTLQTDVAQIESFTFDPTRNRFLAGSSATGEIFCVDLTGKTTPFAKPDAANGIFGVFSLTVDATHNYLYVGTTALPNFKGFVPETLGRGGIARFDLKTGKLIVKYALPFDEKAHIISAMTVAPNGDVYAVDAATNTVYQLHEGKLAPLFRSAEFSSLRGVAVTDDHKFLYLSDYENGLFIASLERNQIRQLSAKNQNLGGIDGLYTYKNQMIALQNGTSPTRVIRVLLGANGISAVQPLEANKPTMSLPSFGAMKGNQLYFIANSQRDQYDVTGKLVSGAKPERRKIYSVNADFGIETALPVLAPMQPK